MFRVDSGANMFVGNQKQHFSRLIMKKIGVELGTSSQGYFEEGVGVIAVSFPTYKDEIFFLYPTYYSSTDKYNTISTGALKSSTGFSSVILNAHQHLELTSAEGKSFKIPCTVIDDIDFISLHIHIIHKTPAKMQKSKIKQPQYKLMSLQPVSITNKSVVGTVLFSVWLHEVYGHRSLAILQLMVDKGYIKGPGLPCKL